MSRVTKCAVLVCLFLSALAACRLEETGLPSLAPTELAYAEYIVQPGDTLGKIAARFNITVQELVAANSERYPTLATNPGLVRVGWQLRIPTAAGALGSTGVPTTNATPGSDLQHADIDEIARLITEGINAVRAGQGLPLLRTDITLTRIASERSADMINRGYFSHNDPQSGREELLSLLRQTRYAFRFAGENIAELKNDAGWVPSLLTVAARYSANDLANEFVKGWLNSPEHRANILNEHYRRSGVSLAFGRDGRRVVATQIFSD